MKELKVPKYTIMYEANDGHMFDSAYECTQYEFMLDHLYEMISSIKCFKCDEFNNLSEIDITELGYINIDCYCYVTDDKYSEYFEYFKYLDNREYPYLCGMYRSIREIGLYHRVITLNGYENKLIRWCYIGIQEDIERYNRLCKMI